MYVIPPMDDEPPAEYVGFVTAQAGGLRRDAARLVGGDRVAERIYLDVLTDVAGHWRRLGWWSRLSGRDAVAGYALRRLVSRAGQWREDQVYPVEVTAIRTEVAHRPAGRLRASYARDGAPPDDTSLALRKAAVLDTTARASLDALADAEIAWVHAWRRSQWRHVLRLAIGGVLLVGGMIQYFTWLSGAAT